jgi:hypothetical protein
LRDHVKEAVRRIDAKGNRRRTDSNSSHQMTAAISHMFTAEELRHFGQGANELLMIEGMKSPAELLNASPVDPAKPVTMKITMVLRPSITRTLFNCEWRLMTKQ